LHDRISVSSKFGGGQAADTFMVDNERKHSSTTRTKTTKKQTRFEPNSRVRNCNIHAETRRGRTYTRSWILGSKNGHDEPSSILPTFITETISSLVLSL